jgi:hypothetical protein
VEYSTVSKEGGIGSLILLKTREFIKGWINRLDLMAFEALQTGSSKTSTKVEKV